MDVLLGVLLFTAVVAAIIFGLLYFHAHFDLADQKTVTEDWRNAHTLMKGERESWEHRALNAETHLFAANAALDAKVKELADLSVSASRKQAKINAITDLLLADES